MFRNQFYITFDLLKNEFLNKGVDYVKNDPSPITAAWSFSRIPSCDFKGPICQCLEYSLFSLFHL